MLQKTSFTELNRISDRKIVLFGSGNIAGKTLRKLDVSRIDFIADNSENLHETTFQNIIVKAPENIHRDHYVIICSTAISEISKQLLSYGLKPDIDFAISPIINDLLAINELEEISTTFYFTSGTIPRDDNPYGGGLYKCNVNALSVSLDKVYSGPCYGAIQKDDDIYFVDTDKGLMRMNEDQEILHLMSWPEKSRAHGISYNETTGCFYVSCSYLDAVLEIESDFTIKRILKLSSKIEQENEPVHHCNDNLALGNSLYVSMFSSTGNWKKDKFDGCVAEINLLTGKREGDIETGLYMPHNICFFDGSLHVLDSLPGHLRFNNFSIQGTFPAFARGLYYFNGLYYVGQSKNRNYSKVLGLSNNISIDCGVIIFNPELKVSRFIQFPYTIGEIHAIVVEN